MAGHKRKRDSEPAKSSATRERILAAAAKVLSHKGYSETRLTDIAEVAQLRAPAVYYYFDSREALIAEVMAVGQSRLRDHVETALAALPPDLDPMDRICAAVQAHLQVELQLSDFATAVTRNMGQLPDDVRGRLRQEGGEYISLWRGLLEAARSTGAIRGDLDLRAARMLIMGALNWTPEWWNPEQGSLAGVVATAQSLVRNGLGYPASQPVA
ncbi:TetR/AcrR family transcriptional regulator [Amycolatopsis echigonensis]|uniref:TetR/AcrR family transcriptional regulator n=1 Tax=Amycolatopsis echigonensis TaxID=2576905 RepID=A0A8E1W773_9PSEU|nr:TetR/AcrR family transcriptional regulator [Amycolatopsis echigonensis]MBB2504927.1 TetR/AcrR family transcriptional regulator [Amycolatopsis echigonensis]